MQGGTCACTGPALLNHQALPTISFVSLVSPVRKLSSPDDNGLRNDLHPDTLSWSRFVNVDKGCSSQT